MSDALNHEIGLTTRSVNVNGGIGKATPYQANYQLCDISMPAGEVYSVGTFSDKRTNAMYSWVYNSHNVHFIKRVNGDGTCQIVYFGCLQLSAEPENYITQFRAIMDIEKVCPNRDGKYLQWTDGTDAGIYRLDVEASIATNSFTTPFFDLCSPDPCDFVRLCVPEICGCIHAEFIPANPDEAGLTNNMLDKGFKLAIKHVYYDGRENEWSTWSSLYYQETTACFVNSSGLSRCLKIRVPVGNAMVEKIKIAFSEDGGLTWFLTETVEKYKKYNDLQQKWYERELAELENFSTTDCSFDYIFCNDKQRVQIATSEMTRVRNPLPREAQGMLQIKDSVGIYNYKDGTCPIDKKEVEKIDIEINCDDGQVDCSSQFATVTVRAIIVGQGDDQSIGGSAVISRLGGDTVTSPDDPSDPAYYGDQAAIPDTHEITFGNTFQGKTRNFITYIEGTDYWGEMKQWQSDPYFTNTKQVGTLGAFNKDEQKVPILIFIRNGGFYYQEYKFKVLKGTRGFLRLTSQTETQGAGESQNTSTSVFAILTDIKKYRGNSQDESLFDRTRKEIYFDTCNGDVNLQEAFTIAAFHKIDYVNYSGYIKDANNLPVEGAIIKASGVTLSITDHNGFYFFRNPNETIDTEINVELDCGVGFHPVQSMTLFGNHNSYSVHTEVITSTNYSNDFYLQIPQRLLDCNGSPVSGIRIAMAGSKSRATGSDGIAHLIARNYSTRNRIIKTVIMNSNGCFTLDCNGQCNPCMPVNIVSAPSCYSHTPSLNMTDLVVNVSSALTVKNGLKAGGRYPIGIVAQGDCGRMSAAYLIKYLDIPRTQQKGKLSFCKYSFDFNDAIFPDWVSCLKLVRGANENPFELQWIVDKFERIGDGKVKITIQSLNDYNQKYFFESNTVYQWTKGDRIEFIRNGDGSILNPGATGILNYLTVSPFNDTLLSGVTNDAKYFNQLIIEDDNRLGNITEGAVIEIQRPKTSTGETIYYDMCVTIPVENGIPKILSGEFSTFDTYIINRTSGSFLGYFESKYPSDFWGKVTDSVGLSDTGKAFVVNQYETEKRYGQNISLSSVTVPNRFGDIIKTICPKGHGDITAMFIWDDQVIMGIAEHDNFLAQSSEDLLRVRADGTVRANSPDDIISDAQPKVRGMFGCQYDSIGSVLFGDGWAQWWDKKRSAYVKHDFSEAKDISEGRVQTFVRKKCQEIDYTNRSVTNPLDKLRFITGINGLTGTVMTTIKALRQNGVNNSLDPYKEQNVTISYHPVANEFLTRAAFTPEGYGLVDLEDEGGCAFISVLNGIPYVHPKITDKYLEFFGIPCDWMFEVSINQYPEKDKTALSFELQSTQKWFVAKVTTENPNFISEIPPVKVQRRMDKYNGAFLKNKNSRGGLFNGDLPRGYFVKSQFIRDYTIADQINTFDNSKRWVYSELGLVLFKFKLNESAGMTENL